MFICIERLNYLPHACKKLFGLGEINRPFQLGKLFIKYQYASVCTMPEMPAKKLPSRKRLVQNVHAVWKLVLSAW